LPPKQEEIRIEGFFRPHAKLAGVESPLQTAMDLHTVKSVLGIGKYEHDSMVLWWSIFGALPVHFAISGVEYHHEVLEWFDTRVVKGCMGAIAGKCL